MLVVAAIPNMARKLAPKIIIKMTQIARVIQDIHFDATAAP